MSWSVDTPSVSIVSKGTRMYRMLGAQLGQASTPQSEYIDFKDLADYGWTFELDPRHKQLVQEADLEALTDAFDELTIDYSKLTNWHRIMLTHTQESRIDRTAGHYEVLVNFNEGVLVATHAWGPEWQNEQKKKLDAAQVEKAPAFFKKKVQQTAIDDDNIVPLKHWSDIVFLGLQAASWRLYKRTDPIRAIKHVFWPSVQDIAVQEQCALISSDTPNLSAIPAKFPGVSYVVTGPEAEQAIATIGTGRGMDVGYLLAVHKKQLGVRKIQRVNIFNSPEKRGGEPVPAWGLYLHLG